MKKSVDADQSNEDENKQANEDEDDQSNEDENDDESEYTFIDAVEEVFRIYDVQIHRYVEHYEPVSKDILEMNGQSFIMSNDQTEDDVEEEGTTLRTDHSDSEDESATERRWIMSMILKMFLRHNCWAW